MVSFPMLSSLMVWLDKEKLILWTGTCPGCRRSPFNSPLWFRFPLCPWASHLMPQLVFFWMEMDKLDIFMHHKKLNLKLKMFRQALSKANA